MTALHVPAGFPTPGKAHGRRLKMSYDEYLVWAGESVMAEWKDGETIVAMPPKYRHQRIAGLLHIVLGSFAAMHQLGIVCPAPFEVRLSPRGPSREPDLLFVAQEHLDLLTDERFEGGPDLVVEVISDDSVTRDRHEKRREYQDAGVHEYWIIDPRARQQQSEFYRLDATGSYRLVEPAGEGAIHSEVMPGFWWRADWFWQDPAPSPQALLAEIEGH